jgi:hypothetical protein
LVAARHSAKPKASARMGNEVRGSCGLVVTLGPSNGVGLHDRARDFADGG